MVHPFKAWENGRAYGSHFLNPISHSVRRAYNFHLVFLLHNSIDVNPLGWKIRGFSLLWSCWEIRIADKTWPIMIFFNSSNQKKGLTKVYFHGLCMDHSAIKLLCKNSKMINPFHNHLFLLVAFLVGINSFSCEGILPK